MWARLNDKVKGIILGAGGLLVGLWLVLVTWFAWHGQMTYDTVNRILAMQAQQTQQQQPPPAAPKPPPSSAAEGK